MSPPLIPNRIQWSRRRKPVIAALLGTVALVAGAITLTFGNGSGGNGTDRLSAAEAAQRESTFAGMIALPLVASGERDAAIDTMALPPKAQASLKADLEAGRSALAWIEVWDDQAADGDRIRISAGGFDLDLDLYKAPHRIGIPVTGPSPGLAITGLHDGGGGITVGIQTLKGTVLTPVIRPGQVLPIGLR
ncbi:hypothetical protein [Aureimonas pseudogalii]|uniref:Uncharacterized protein n=1 Tax=Aureimonas pseudogalii TaxID=1744844 RepID=A0A7W6H8B3_9HYPH|nr:hypothetical protein [Aureimonas pseudogalii]MBB4000489.1 hypothetical protein [Aureimonas pseudogalii]